MSAFRELQAMVDRALDALAAQGVIAADVDRARVTVEPPRDESHGEAATNAALILSKAARAKPMELAAKLAQVLMGEAEIIAAEPAAPGFVNLRLTPGFWQREVASAIASGESYGRFDLGRGREVNVEYCSANPTGPLHVGHARGTVFGDALASLLAHMGYAVTREYYVNDAGAQIEILARSLHHRYREALGDAVGPVADGLYPGEYLIPVGKALAEQFGDRYRHAPESDWLEDFAQLGVAAMLVLIKGDLGSLGVHHDVFTSERGLVTSGEVDDALAAMEAMGLLYTGVLEPPKGKTIEDWEPRPQLLFKATAYGDEVDRPLRRSSGHWTYFAADIAYHRDKFRRGFKQMIDVWGADHGGYVRRMEAAVRAFSAGEAHLDVKLCQLVNLMDDGKPLKMSKRAGRIVTLRDVVDEVGKDVVRFMLLTRRNDASLDFDLKKVTEQSKDNPVFYVQYAHARICSVFRNAVEAGETVDGLRLADLSLLADPAEIALVRAISQWPRILEAACLQAEPHRLAFYLQDLAAAFHALWAKGREQTDLRFLISGNSELTRARLALIDAVRIVLAGGLGLIGVTPVEEMH